MGEGGLLRGVERASVCVCVCRVNAHTRDRMTVRRRYERGERRARIRQPARVRTTVLLAWRPSASVARASPPPNIRDSPPPPRHRSVHARRRCQGDCVAVVDGRACTASVFFLPRGRPRDEGATPQIRHPPHNDDFFGFFRFRCCRRGGGTLFQNNQIHNRWWRYLLSIV